VAGAFVFVLGIQALTRCRRVVRARERTIYEPMLRTLGAADGGGGGVG